MGTKKTLTLKEAMEMEGFVPLVAPKDTEMENLEVQIISMQKYQELSKKGAEFLIDSKSKYVFFHNRGKLYVYAGVINGPGEYPESQSFVITKKNIQTGVSKEKIAKSLNAGKKRSDPDYTSRSELDYHLGKLEEAGLLEKPPPLNLRPISMGSWLNYLLSE